MNDEMPGLRPPSLCATWFRVVADTGSAENPYIDLKIRTLALGPHIDALQIFKRYQKHLVESVADTEEGLIVVRVHKSNLLALAEKIEFFHKVTIPTFGRKDENRVGYQNGRFTPCDTPYHAMKMALDHP